MKAIPPSSLGFVVVVVFFFSLNVQALFLIFVLFCPQNLLLSFSCNQLTTEMFLKPNAQYYKTLDPVNCHSRTLLTLPLHLSKGSLYLAKLYRKKKKRRIPIPSHEQWHLNSLTLSD